MKSLKVLCIGLGLVMFSARGICSKDSYEAGIAAYKDGLFDIAIKQLEEYINSNPQGSIKDNALILLVECYYKKGLYNKAEKTLKEITSEEFQDARLYWEGKLLKIRGKIQQAFETFTTCRYNYPSSKYLPYIEYEIAALFYKNGEYRKALQVVNKFIRNHSSHLLMPETIIIGVKSFILLDRLDKAETWLRKLLQLTTDPKIRSEGYYLLGIVYEKLGLYMKATRFFYRTAKKPYLQKYIRERILYRIADIYWSKGEFKEAAHWFLIFIRNFQQSEFIPSAMLRLAESYMALRKFNKAEKYLKYVLANYPEHKEKGLINFLLAESLLHSGKLYEAENLYKKVIRNKANEKFIDKVLFSLGILHMKKGSYKEARNKFLECVNRTSIKKLKLEAIMKIAQTYLEEGKYEKAISKYTEILEQYPGVMSPKVLYKLGQVYTMLEEYDKALSAYNSVIAGYPHSEYAEKSVLKRALVLQDKGTYEEAVKAFYEALRKVKNERIKANILYHLGELYLFRKEYQKALEVFLKVVKFYTNYPQVYYPALYKIGISYYYLGKMEEAIQFFKEYTLKVPQDMLQDDVLFWIGNIYFEQGYYEIAERSFCTLEKVFPNSPLADDALYLAGLCYIHLNRYQEAKEIYKELITQYPKSSLLPDGMYRLAETLIFLGEYEESIKLFETIRKKWPEIYFKDSLLMREADVYKASGNWKKAIELYETAVNLTKFVPYKIAGLYNIANLYEKLGKFSTSIEKFLEIVYKYPARKEWCAKSALRAALLYEKIGKYNEAKKLYKKVSEMDVAERGLALEKLEKLADIKG